MNSFKLKQRKKYWYKFANDQWELDELLDHTFTISKSFITDEKSDSFRNIPSFLLNHSQIKKIRNNPDFFRTKVASFSKQTTSDLRELKKEYREQLKGIYKECKVCYEAIINGLKFQLQREQQRINNSENYTSDTGTLNESYEILTDFFHKIVTGCEVQKALKELGNLPNNYLQKSIQKNLPLYLRGHINFYNVIKLRHSYSHKFTQEISLKRNKYFEFLGSAVFINTLHLSESSNSKEYYETPYGKIGQLYNNARKNRREQFKTKYSFPIEMIEIEESHEPSLASYTWIKRYPDNYDESIRNNNALYRLEKYQEKALPYAIDYIAIQEALNPNSTIIDEDSKQVANFLYELDKQMREYIIEFCDSFGSDRSYITLIAFISTLQKDNTGKVKKVIKEARNKHEPLKNVPDSSLYNWKNKWNQFLKRAQQ